MFLIAAIVVILISLITLMFAYVKLFHRFWYIQPCFHFYDIYKYVQQPKVICMSPIESEYYNSKNIVTKHLKNVTNLELDDMIWLIRHHFLRNKRNVFSPDLKKNFLPYFNEDCFLSFYYTNRILLDNPSSRCLQDKQLVGVITSAVVEVELNSTSLKAFYVDYLCVHKQQRKRGIAEQLIQTHERNQRHKAATAVHVSLFKREGTLTFIVPLCVYKSYLRDITKPVLLRDTSSIQITPFREMFEFIDAHKRYFKCCILYPPETILELIKTQNIFSISLMDGDDIVAMYFFKDTCTFRKQKKILMCSASICTKQLDVIEFQNGFDSAVSYVNTLAGNVFDAVLIERISHNEKLLNQNDLFFADMAFFFYNFIYASIDSSNVLSLL